MSNEQGVSNPSPGQSQMIPKERFDEIVAEKRAAQEQIQVLQTIVRQAVPNRQQAPQEEKDSPEMERLKEENPIVYQKVKEQEFSIKRQSAALFAMGDNQDRTQFIQEFGEMGREKLPEVEAELERLRANGIHNYNRGQILVHMEGQRAIQTARKPKEQVAPKVDPQASAPQTSSVPSSDPSAAGTTSGSSAPAASTGQKTIEELEKSLADYKF